MASSVADPVKPAGNRLLCALPADVLGTLAPHLGTVALTLGEVLFDANETVLHVYFPDACVLSLVSHLEVGGIVEVGTVGCEGFVDLSSLLGGGLSSVRALAQVPGGAQRMAADAFDALTMDVGPLRRLMLRYSQTFLLQVAQTAACNAAHLVVARCARWLLMTSDRVGDSKFPLSPECLAFMLGVRRAGVSTAMSALQGSGSIRYGRGWVEIVNRTALEGASCECYAVVRGHYARLLEGPA